MYTYLTKHSDSSGTVQLDGAKAHWWVLTERLKDDGRQDMWSHQHVQASAGHAAALYQNELYEMRTGRAGQNVVQAFGVIFGHSRVVIYVEPDEGVTTNHARTMLLRDGRPLPWAAYQEQFRNNLPPEIKALIDSIASKCADKDDNKSIVERLRPLMNLFAATRYRRNPKGTQALDADLVVPGGTPPATSGSGTAGAGGPHRPPRPGGSYGSHIKNNGLPASPYAPDKIPRVTWVSLARGSRDPGEMEDKAARYFEAQNLVKVNGDFRKFHELVDWCVKEWNLSPTVIPTLRQEIEEWTKQALIEVVMGIEALRGTSPEWGSDACDRALSEEALTTALMARYHLIYAAKRNIGTKIGKLLDAT
ncbi:hypothetical protein WMF30_00835 [Sorangium sp. So ce134]